MFDSTASNDIANLNAHRLGQHSSTVLVTGLTGRLPTVHRPNDIATRQAFTARHFRSKISSNVHVVIIYDTAWQPNITESCIPSPLSNNRDVLS